MRCYTKLLLLSLLLAGCAQQTKFTGSSGNTKIPDNAELATFAGGCFWCIEAPFEGIDGIYSVTSGYSGGKEKDPTYSEVSAGKTGHKESVQIVYDPEVISYSELIDLFWKQFDPTDKGGSFHDRGPQYQSAIFYHSDEQQRVAKASKEKLNRAGIFKDPIATEITRFQAFYPAEDYHQDYYKKNSANYKAYRKASGRDDFIKAHWEVPSASKYPRPSRSKLKEQLSSLQYRVTMENATEKPFDNAYYDNKKPGIYVCIVSGAPLFSSKDKFKSGTGWPSFTKPIDVRLLEKPVDRSGGMTRVEVRSKYGNSHLGHVFYDGPKPTRLRYCMNSAALRFIPLEEMKKEGYQHYLWLVEEGNGMEAHR